MSEVLTAFIRGALSQTIAMVSLHSDNPAGVGLNELDVPRQPIEWDSDFSNASDIRWDIPRMTTIRYVGLWSADGVFYESRKVDEERFTRDGAYYLRAGKLRILVRVNG